MKRILVGEFELIRNDIGGALDQMRGARVLITGATGLIGSYLTDFLLYMNYAHGWNMEISVVSRSSDKLRARFGAACDLNFIEMDLSRPRPMPQRFDYVIHAASPAHPAAYRAQPVDVIRANLFGTATLLDTAIGADGRLLFVSSSEIYGASCDGKAFVETDCGFTDCNSVRSCYPESKRAAEVLCLSHAAQYGTHINIARPCHVYGPTITDENTRADAQFLRRALRGADIELSSRGNQRRTWCYVADCVCAMLQILLCGENCAAYNIANATAVASIFEFAEILARIAGCRVRCTSDAPGGTDSILDATKLMNIGWRPHYDLTRGLRHTFEIARLK